jgi:hypothetical protein
MCTAAPADLVAFLIRPVLGGALFQLRNRHFADLATECVFRIAATYRDLRRSLEAKSNQPGVADFYYGEMEMRRHSHEAGLWEWPIVTMCWMFSGYGLRGQAFTAPSMKPEKPQRICFGIAVPLTQRRGKFSIFDSWDRLSGRAYVNDLIHGLAMSFPLSVVFGEIHLAGSVIQAVLISDVEVDATRTATARPTRLFTKSLRSCVHS